MSSGARIVILMLAAVAGVLGFSQGVLALGGEAGLALSEELTSASGD